MSLPRECPDCHDARDLCPACAELLEEGLRLALAIGSGDVIVEVRRALGRYQSRLSRLPGWRWRLSYWRTCWWLEKHRRRRAR